MNVRFLVGLALTALTLAGCAGMGEKQTSTAHVACTVEGQEGCVTLRVFNLKWDESNPVMAGLDKPYTSEEERQRRVQFVPETLQKAYENGAGASQGRSFLLYVFRGNEVPASHISVYRGETWERVVVGDVTDTVKNPVFEGKDLGKPTRVYRFRTGEGRPGVVAVQFPRSMLTEWTHLLTCTEDRLTVYPNRVTANEGLWIHEESLPWLLNRKRSGGDWVWIQTFLSKDHPATSVAGGGTK